MVCVLSCFGCYLACKEPNSSNSIFWLSSRTFFRGKIYCYANFSIVFGPNFRGGSLRGKKLPQRAPPCLPVEESQSLDRLNKHFQGIVEKVRENSIPSQNVKGTITTKISAIFLFNVTIICIQEFVTTRCSIYAVKINALYTLPVQINVALKCFTVQLQRMFNKDFLVLNAQKIC